MGLRRFVTDFFVEPALNWRDYDAPFSTKLRLALRNNWIKIRTLSSCCGNNGEPGC